MLSIWEQQSFVDKDIVIIGSGITGLSAAAYIAEKHPEREVTILERGFFPSGASTKNAGFACFGSLTEIVDDLIHMPEQEVVNLVELRLRGLALLKERLGTTAIGFEQLGGHELIQPTNRWCLDKLDYVNELLRPIFGRHCFEQRSELITKFGFGNAGDSELVYTPFEGQLHTGMMMKQLMAFVRNKNVEVYTNTEVTDLEDHQSFVKVNTAQQISLRANQVLVANNGFVSKLLPEVDVKPGRGLVLSTKPIKNLQIRGTFHMEMGYYYFRNLDNRLVLGGGRNLDFDGETSMEAAVNPKIISHLEQMLHDVILPGYDYEIETVWTGTMGFGPSKSATIRAISDNITIGVGLGGMGVAIGSIIGEQLAKLSLTGFKEEF